MLYSSLGVTDIFRVLPVGPVPFTRLGERFWMPPGGRHDSGTQKCPRQPADLDVSLI